MKPTLGVDLSLVSCGFAVYDGTTLHTTGVIKTKSTQSKPERRAIVLKMLKSLCATYSIKQIVFEQVRLFHNSRISMNAITALVSLSTTIEDWAYKQEIPVTVVATNSWRAKVLGNGRAGKEECVRWVKETFKREVRHDEADAVGLSVYPFSLQSWEDSQRRSGNRRPTRSGTRR